MNHKLIAATFALLLIGAGCASRSGQSPTLPPNGPSAAADTDVSDVADGAHGDGGHHVSALAGSRIALDDKNALKPGVVSLRFKLYGLDGHEFGASDLQVQHEKKMHLLLVRDDMTGFQHLHPEYTDGKWVVATDVPEAGLYQMYVDIDPEEEEPIVLRVPLTIGGQTAKKEFPIPNEDRSATTGVLKAVLNTAGAIKSHEETMLTFVITNGGKPVTAIGPYLGAYGHVVLLRHGDPDDFFHVHPVTETKPEDGRVEFEATFPVKGRYTLYAQLDIAGNVRTFPITVDVSEEGAEAGSRHDHETEPEESAGGHHQ